jgi:hypothetical protein
MTDDPVAKAAAKANRRRLAITTTASLLQRRLDPRLIAADLAKIALARSVARVARIRSTPAQRKRALIGAGIAIATTIGMRVLYRNAAEKPSPETQDDVKRLT